jgi:hypothetical protein
MTDYPIPSAALRAAMDAHKDLNIFAAIQGILESGAAPNDCAAARKIIAICKSEQQRQLRLMDRAVAKVNKEAP